MGPARLLAGTRGSWLAPFRVLAACRILRFPSKLAQLWSLNFLRPYFSVEDKRAAFFFLTHNHYLSKYFTVAQRIDCAIAHYGFERQNYGPAYHRSVYQSLLGLTLWHRVVDRARYTIILRATEDNRHEGDLSVLCFVNDTRVCRMAFSYVNSSLFGLQSEPAMFVTRSQMDRNPELQRFRDTFKQNSPNYFCLASVWGIAMANGMHAIFLVKDDAQIAYAKRYAEGFRNSYSALWEAFGATEIDGRGVYTMSIPPRLAPLRIVTHKNRAARRRRNWREILLSTRQAMLEDRTSRVPPPIEGDDHALLADLAGAQSEILTAIQRTGAYRAM